MLLGMASPPCEPGGSFIQGAISPPQQRQLDSEERIWVGMESEMVHEKVRAAGCTLPTSHIFFVLAGLHAEPVLLWAISVGKKRSKPRDNLVNDPPVLANLV